MERRYADQSPAWLIPRLAATQNMRQLWAESAQKRKHDHRLQFRAMGAEDIIDKQSSDEMPGDINIKGDESNTHTHYHAAPVAPTQSPAAQAARSGLWKYIGLPILGAALLGTGAAGTAIYNWATHKPDTTQPSGKFDYRYGIEQRPTPDK